MAHLNFINIRKGKWIDMFELYEMCSGRKKYLKVV